MIFNSDAKALIWDGSVFGLTIFTATVVVVFLSIIPMASALKTTPNAPEPSCLPENKIINYLHRFYKLNTINFSIVNYIIIIS